ncbi:15485_t:CDS:10 [Racocetra fulgida]|uniref:15485_t:CDS:1 n=1 Tax=Racocetra fulgida TaxID=60492 RepID=A0A9N9B775_9GLOM|nr:15485_t:CDS:10 [Racocetra fulgida]
MDTLKDVPEFFETQLDESIAARTENLASFRELGPPDLCHITKSNAKPGVKEVGSYHYVSGVDASSSATLAAYLNSLTYALFDYSSCFNAFSRVDVRVEVKIPGGVETTPEMWQETYISALLRSILYSDDANYRLAGFRKLDPIPNIEAEAHFLEAAESLFFKDPEIQVATVVSNHLTTDEEIKAVNILYEALKQNQMSYALLHVQTDFLLSKGKKSYALKLAKQAVNCAPSEFVTWAKLTEVYIELEDYESALLTLNSCPMFTYNDRDMHRMPTPAKTHLPIKQEISSVGLLDDDNGRDTEADVGLLRLPAPSLRGTFAKAYSLLTRLVAKIGWDELLKCRSSVFVMEEEYRMQKAAEEERRNQKLAVNNKPHEKEDNKEPDVVKVKTNGVNDSSQSIPTITISGDSNNDKEHNVSPDSQENQTTLETVNEVPEQSLETEQSLEETDNHDDNEEQEQKKYINHNAPADEQSVDSLEEVNLDDEQSGVGETSTPVIEFKGPELEKPTQAANDDKNESQSQNNDEQNKDLRVYTVWRSEVAHYKAHQMSYRKTGTEWEILGDLAARLHHKGDAKEAYTRCLDNKFSAKAWLRLLEFYAEEGDVPHALSAVYPTAIAYNLNKLIRSEGLSKIHYNLISMNLPPPVAKLVTRYLIFAETFKIPGSDF